MERIEEVAFERIWTKLFNQMFKYSAQPKGGVVITEITEEDSPDHTNESCELNEEQPVQLHDESNNNSTEITSSLTNQPTPNQEVTNTIINERKLTGHERSGGVDLINKTNEERVARMESNERDAFMGSASLRISPLENVTEASTIDAMDEPETHFNFTDTSGESSPGSYFMQNDTYMTPIESAIEELHRSLSWERDISGSSQTDTSCRSTNEEITPPVHNVLGVKNINENPTENMICVRNIVEELTQVTVNQSLQPSGTGVIIKQVSNTTIINQERLPSKMMTKKEKRKYFRREHNEARKRKRLRDLQKIDANETPIDLSTISDYTALPSVENRDYSGEFICTPKYSPDRGRVVLKIQRNKLLSPDCSSTRSVIPYSGKNKYSPRESTRLGEGSRNMNRIDPNTTLDRQQIFERLSHKPPSSTQHSFDKKLLETQHMLSGLSVQQKSTVYAPLIQQTLKLEGNLNMDLKSIICSQEHQQNERLMEEETDTEVQDILNSSKRDEKRTKAKKHKERERQEHEQNEETIIKAKKHKRRKRHKKNSKGNGKEIRASMEESPDFQQIDNRGCISAHHFIEDNFYEPPSPVLSNRQSKVKSTTEWICDEDQSYEAHLNKEITEDIYNTLENVEDTSINQESQENQFVETGTRRRSTRKRRQIINLLDMKERGDSRAQKKKKSEKKARTKETIDYLEGPIGNYGWEIDPANMHTNLNQNVKEMADVLTPKKAKKKRRKPRDYNWSSRRRPRKRKPAQPKLAKPRTPQSLEKAADLGKELQAVKHVSNKPSNILIKFDSYEGNRSARDNIPETEEMGVKQANAVKKGGRNKRNKWTEVEATPQDWEEWTKPRQRRLAATRANEKITKILKMESFD